MRTFSLLLLSALLLTACSRPASAPTDSPILLPDSFDLLADSAALVHACQWWPQTQEDKDARMEWYRAARFGCFVHWGVYANAAGWWNGQPVGGYSEHLMRLVPISLADYRTQLINTFNPTAFDAEEWMQQVEDAGMRYFIITAKHHDGFAMYPSEAYPYDIRLTPFNRDIMAELREAARRHHIKFGFYYSQAIDWEHPDGVGNDWDFPGNPGNAWGPDVPWNRRHWWAGHPELVQKAERYFSQKALPQVMELIDRYDPDILWFDMSEFLPLHMNVSLLEAIRSHDAGHRIVVNGRLASFATGNLGDYINTGDRAAHFPPQSTDWESIPTTNESYGYSTVDRSHKPATHFVRLLADAVSKDGNILMNVGPMGNGRWDSTDTDIFRSVGQWLRVNGAAIYGAGSTDLPAQTWGVTTQKHDTLYALVFSPNADGRIFIDGLRSTVASACLLSNLAETLTFSQTADGCLVQLPSTLPDTACNTVALTLSDRRPSCPFRTLGTNLSRLLPPNNCLRAFDATFKSPTLTYGDGKPGRDYVAGWDTNSIDTAQCLEWQVRQGEQPAQSYDLYLEADWDDGSATFEVTLGGQTFTIRTADHSAGHSAPIYIGTLRQPDFSTTTVRLRAAGPDLHVYSLTLADENCYL